MGMTSQRLTDVEILDYYDGILTAVAKCRECRCAVIFSVMAWEPYAELRVYGVADISEDEVNRLLKDGPVEGSSSQRDVPESFDLLLEGVLQRHEPGMLVVAADLTREILGVREFVGNAGFPSPLDCMSEAKLAEYLKYFGMGAG